MNQMTTEQDAQRVKRLAERAVQLAMQARWAEAIDLNRDILSRIEAQKVGKPAGRFATDEAEALNRLGKALSEAGKIKEAREIYQRALELQPSNTIARKNLERLASLKGKAEPDRAQQVDASLFIEEMGKTGVTLLRPMDAKLLATLSAGDEVVLATVGSRLAVSTAGGDHIGNVEPKLATRLTRLIAGGNKYAAAVAGRDGDAVRVIIKETFQHPNQVGKLSFPAGKAGETVRPYIRESMVRTDHDDEEEGGEEAEEWDDGEAEGEAETGDVSLFDAAVADDGDDDEEFEE